jgi:hypothetical protein
MRLCVCVASVFSPLVCLFTELYLFQPFFLPCKPFLTPAPQCEFRVHDNVSEIVSLGDGEAVYSCNNRDISFAKTSDDKLTFSFIVHDRRLEKIQCSSFLLDSLDEEKPSVRRCLDQVCVCVRVCVCVCVCVWLSTLFMTSSLLSNPAPLSRAQFLPVSLSHSLCDSPHARAGDARAFGEGQGRAGGAR